MQSYISKVTSRGQITIPQKLREEEKITEDDYVIIRKVGKYLLVAKQDIELEDITSMFQAEARTKGITKKVLMKDVESVRKARYQKGFGPHAHIR